MALNGFTATHKKILALLDDGMSHDDDSIRAALGDYEMELHTIKVHISNIRKLLGIHGKDIVRRQGYWQMVRFTSSSARG